MEKIFLGEFDLDELFRAGHLLLRFYMEGEGFVERAEVSFWSGDGPPEGLEWATAATGLS